MVRRPRPRTAAAVLGILVLAGAVGGSVGLALDRPSDRERSRAVADRACAREYVTVRADLLDGGVRLDPVGVADEPVALAVDPRGEAPVLLGEREGAVLVVDDDGRITDERVLQLGDTSDHGDGGLLGLAYDPDGGWLYAYRSTSDQDDLVSAFPLDDDGRPDQAGEVELVRSGHPSSEQHHGGAFGFGPDGLLYIGFGDGGGHGDPGENAQDRRTLLGKLLRIDPTPGEAAPYQVPPDNPFVDRPGWRPEIWAFGVRNPYRLSFDVATGELWLGDVGHSCREEIDRLTDADAGANLGWDHFEGTTTFEGGDPAGHVVWPEHTYPHDAGWCALVLGPVVHDEALPELDGWLLHTDYCRGRIMGFRPRRPGEPAQVLDTGLRVERPVAIVEGPDGLPWVLSLDGEVRRIVPGR